MLTGTVELYLDSEQWRTDAPDVGKLQAHGHINPEKNMMQRRCLKRSEDPADLVGTAIFLASDMSNFITGQLILCDGGSSFH